VQGPATSTLSELVRTYPNIDFHRATQKLAIGTSEGASIMYDLKTATRLYVLTTPGITQPCTALSFSPDGRRLVTLFLDAHSVSVWKVGSSLLGLVTWGKVPRQHGVQSTTDEGPFKTFGVPLTPDNSNLQAADILNLVSMDWLGDRSVRLRIREAAFTFSLS
jgi:WD40 repeat protein